MYSSCNTNAVTYRRETPGDQLPQYTEHRCLHRSLKKQSILEQLAMPKSIIAGPNAESAKPVRLLSGNWDDLCVVVAEELAVLGAGRPQIGSSHVPTAAILAFSTSEKEHRHRKSPPLALCHVHARATILRLPRVNGVLRDAEFPRYVRRGAPCFQLLQRTDHLRFAVFPFRHTLLLVPQNHIRLTAN